MTTSRWLRTLGLAAVAVGTSLVLLRGERDEDEAGARARLGVGYYMREPRLMGTGEDGHLLYRLSAASAQQALADGVVSLSKVELRYEPADTVPWDLRAQRGQIPPDGKIIILSGNVEASSQPASAQPTRIRTDYLELIPDEYVARTDRGVRIERGGDMLQAQGMRAFLKEDRLQLTSDVRGRFAP